MEKQASKCGEEMRFLFFIIVLSLFLSGCTYSITLVHTEGVASDVVDETSSATPTTNISIPTM